MAEIPDDRLPKEPEPKDPAMTRYWMLQLMRLGGVLLVVGAVLILGGKLPAPPVLGYGLLLLGVFEFFALPKMLASRWKSPASDE